MGLETVSWGLSRGGRAGPGQPGYVQEIVTTQVENLCAYVFVRAHMYVHTCACPVSLMVCLCIHMH